MLHYNPVIVLNNKDCGNPFIHLLATAFFKARNSLKKSWVG